jgi:hypothetical protein
MKKYRTKSGKVEEKLPGINATVSPSEKVQIAMAGGANTLSDVQTILGQSGKRNNLKGQGAKNIVSFQYEDYEYEAYATPADPGQDPEEGEPSPTGSKPFTMTDLTAMQDSNPWNLSKKRVRHDPSGAFFSGGSDTEVFLKDADSWLSKQGMPGYDKHSKFLAGAFRGAQAKKTRAGVQTGLVQDLEVEEKDKEAPSPLTFWTDKPLPPVKEFNLVARSVDRLKPNAISDAPTFKEADYLSLEGFENRAYRTPGWTAAAAIAPFPFNIAALIGGAIADPGPGVAGHNNPRGPYSGWQATSPVFKPTPTPDDGGTKIPACPKGSTKSASGACLPITSNNTTLAVVDKKDTRASRSQLRSQATRRA